MKHTHVIEAANAEEFKKHVKELYHALHSDDRMTDEPQRPLPAPGTTEMQTSEKPQEEKPKKTKKAKEEKEPVAAPVSASAPTPATPAAEPEASADDIFGGDEAPKAPPVMVPYTMDDCQKRLQAVVSKAGIVKAKELLARFGIAKLVELPKDKFTNFITDCDELT